MSGPKSWPLSFAIEAMGAKTLSVPKAQTPVHFAGAASDSREVKPGRLFFALPGERVDGFDFCSTAVQAGAAAVVVPAERGTPSGCETVPVLAVADPRRALGDLARAVRATFKGRVVGITGSNGKTTTKELVAAALGATGTGAKGANGEKSVLRTSGNLNTDVGLPLTVLEATGDEAFWVLEMAMRARGEIAYLAEIARPHIGLVTNVAAAHIGRLGSIEEVAKAKGEIFHGLAADGIAILPVGDDLLEREAAHLPPGCVRRFGGFGLKPTGAVAEAGEVRILDFHAAGTSGSLVRFDVAGQPAVTRLPLAGEHNARNAAAALAVVSALNLPVQPAAQALERTGLPPHRSRLLSLGGRTVLDDCYNANPASMAAALRALVGSAGTSGRSFVVLGDMFELGDDAPALHTALGRAVVKANVAGVAAVGTLAVHIAEGARAAGLSSDQVLSTEDPVRAAEAVAAWSRPGDWILVKASRGMKLERAVEALERELAAPAAPKPTTATTKVTTKPTKKKTSTKRTTT